VKGYLARRALFAAMLVFLVSSGAMLLARLAPGDFASSLAAEGASPAQVAQERARYGLDRPIAPQYVAWLWRAAHLDLGESLLYRRPVGELVRERAANTALLAMAALALATLAGLPAGVYTGSRSNAGAWLVRAGSLVLLSLPSLVTSLVLVLLAARTGWLPVGGMVSGASSGASLTGWWIDVARHLPLPALALALPLAATLERLQSQAVADALGQPFTLAAMARGVPRRRVVWRHALRASLSPVASVYGYVLAALLSGSFIVEVVTAWPGLGRLLYDGLRARDVYLVAGCAAAGSMFLAIGSLLSDLTLAWAEPRMRRG
jgi:peptide/nickel transport system permease protein